MFLNWLLSSYWHLVFFFVLFLISFLTVCFLVELLTDAIIREIYVWRRLMWKKYSSKKVRAIEKKRLRVRWLKNHRYCALRDVYRSHIRRVQTSE